MVKKSDNIIDHDYSERQEGVTLLDGDLVPGLRHTQPVEEVRHALRGHEGVREEFGPPGDVVQGGRDDDQQAEEERAGHRHQVLQVLFLKTTCSASDRLQPEST